MRYYESECRGCEMHCIYNSCSYYRVEHFRCDYCKEEDVRLYDYHGDEICEECLLKEFSVIEGSDC